MLEQCLINFLQDPKIFTHSMSCFHYMKWCNWRGTERWISPWQATCKHRATT